MRVDKLQKRWESHLKGLLVRTTDKSEANEDDEELQPKVEEVVDGPEEGVNHDARARVRTRAYDEGEEQPNGRGEPKVCERRLRGDKALVATKRAQQRGDLVGL